MPHPISTASPAEFSREFWRLYHLALPDDDAWPRFSRIMNRANAEGKTYIEGLEMAARV